MAHPAPTAPADDADVVAFDDFILDIEVIPAAPTACKPPTPCMTQDGCSTSCPSACVSGS
ncbi:FxLD family lanthipeptide [Nocardiopsis coralliicola]